MSLGSLLSLQNGDIELVITAVRKWCEDRDISPDPDRGWLAMTSAVSLVLAGEQSPATRDEKLRPQMSRHQYKAPADGQ